MTRALWTCPRCRARFVTRNLSHSCVARTVDDFFADKPPGGVALARAFIAEVERVGPITLHAVKTRIALMVEVRFAAIYRVGADAIRGHLWLVERHRTTRFERIEELGGNYLYHFEVSDRRPIDDELRRFIARAYAIGQRAHLTARASPRRTPRPAPRARARRPPG